MRDRFLTGPGPDKGVSNPGRVGWTHMPEKSGAVATTPVCPMTGVVAAAANATNIRNSRRRMLMIPVSGSARRSEVLLVRPRHEGEIAHVEHIDIVLCARPLIVAADDTPRADIRRPGGGEHIRVLD